jgi:hypothetical protein
MSTSIRRAYLNKRLKESIDEISTNSNTISHKSIIQKTINESQDQSEKNIINKKIPYIKTEMEKKSKNDKTHEDNLKMIENLQKELDNIEKENAEMSKNIFILKKESRQFNEEYNKINNDIQTQKNECENLKQESINKKREFLNLIVTRAQRERALNLIERVINNARRNNTDNRRNRRAELNRIAFRSAIERLVDLYRRRRDDENDPPIPYEQIQNLPSSFYPRNNRNNEKCTLCGFVFCYNDVIIKLTNCNHIFHKNCLVNRLTIRQSSRCPICKISVL